MVDFDEIARRKKQSRDDAERELQAKKRQGTECQARLLGFWKKLVDAFVSEIENFNAKRLPSERVEVTREEYAIDMKRQSFPAGRLNVSLTLESESANLRWVVSGPENDGTPEDTESYIVRCATFGLDIKRHGGAIMTPEKILNKALESFADRIS